MSEPNFLLKSLRDSAGIRLAVLFGSFLIFLLFTSVLNSIILNLPIGSERTHILWSSLIQGLFAFCIPAIIVAHFSSNDWKQWLELTRFPQLKSILGVIVVYLISLPAMESLVEWNANLHFPESLSSLEALFRSWEDSSADTTKIILEAHGWISVFIGVLVIGVFTGFSEELFFRGGIQGIFIRSNMGKATGVWCAALIFSTMHFQFFGFLPRLLMGAFFGYTLLWTRSIWVPVFAHILNNSMVVITAALSDNFGENIIPENDNTAYFSHPIAILSSVVLTSLFFILYRKLIFKSEKSPELSWQKNQQPPVSES